MGPVAWAYEHVSHRITRPVVALASRSSPAAWPRGLLVCCRTPRCHLPKLRATPSRCRDMHRGLVVSTFLGNLPCSRRGPNGRALGPPSSLAGDQRLRRPVVLTSRRDRTSCMRALLLSSTPGRELRGHSADASRRGSHCAEYCRRPWHSPPWATWVCESHSARLLSSRRTT